MRRREYLAAAAAVLGVTAGCLDQSETMSQEQAYNEFERIAVFSAPDDSNARRVARMVELLGRLNGTGRPNRRHFPCTNPTVRMVDGYSKAPEYEGVLRKRGGERHIDLIDEDIHPKNQVRVYDAWEHDKHDIIVLTVYVEQRGPSGSHFNSLYVVEDGEPEEITFGWPYTSESHWLKTKKTKDDLKEDAKEWMRDNPEQWSTL